MRVFFIAFMLALFSSATIAHEMTPTYPKMRPSHMDNVYVTTMEMFNKRKDVEYYEIGVFDEEWNAVPFVTSYEIINIRYLGHVTFDIYIRKSDVGRAEYICSKSKLRKDSSVRTAISSKICSRIK
jgi:hypothetical protein